MSGVIVLPLRHQTVFPSTSVNASASTDTVMPDRLLSLRSKRFQVQNKDSYQLVLLDLI